MAIVITVLSDGSAYNDCMRIYSDSYYVRMHNPELGQSCIYANDYACIVVNTVCVLYEAWFVCCLASGRHA